MIGRWRPWERLEAARRLTRQARREGGEPPPDLLRRLLDDVPDRPAMAYVPAPADGDRHGLSRRWVAAASLAAALAAGVIGLRVWERQLRLPDEAPAPPPAAARPTGEALSERSLPGAGQPGAQALPSPVMPPAPGSAAPEAQRSGGVAPAPAEPRPEARKRLTAVGYEGAGPAPALQERASLKAPSPSPASEIRARANRWVPAAPSAREPAASPPVATPGAAAAPPPASESPRVAGNPRAESESTARSEAVATPAAPRAAVPARGATDPAIPGLAASAARAAAPPVSAVPAAPAQASQAAPVPAGPAAAAAAPRQGAAPAAPPVASPPAAAPQRRGLGAAPRAAPSTSGRVAKAEPVVAAAEEAGRPATATSGWLHSSFGIDLGAGAGSYRRLRRELLDEGRLPRAASVRAGELASAFDLAARTPAAGGPELLAEGAPLPSTRGAYLLRFDVRGLAPASGLDAVEVDFDPAVVARFQRVGVSVHHGAAAALYEIQLRRPVAPAADLGARSDRTVAVLRAIPGERVGARDAIVQDERVVRLSDLHPSWEAASPALRTSALAVELAQALAAEDPAPRLVRLQPRAQALAAELPDEPKAAELLQLIQRAADLAGARGGAAHPP
jgi:hypothetical protein